MIEKLMNSASQQHSDFTEFVSKGLKADVVYTKEDVVQQLFKTVQKLE